jgi:hypothetical protein
MIVLGADMHKSSHTIAAVAAGTGELLGDETVDVGKQGFAAVLGWARGLDGERVWALEDCRHVSGAFERFLLGRGERVVRVTSRLRAGERRVARERGKSDRIDALAVARAALREGLDRLPVAELAGVELDIRLLVDHRERLVRTRTAIYNDLLWHLHDLWPEPDRVRDGCRTGGATWPPRRRRGVQRSSRSSADAAFQEHHEGGAATARTLSWRRHCRIGSGSRRSRSARARRPGGPGMARRDAEAA